MIILHFHLLPQFKYELFHIHFTSLIFSFAAFRSPWEYQALIKKSL